MSTISNEQTSPFGFDLRNARQRVVLFERDDYWTGFLLRYEVAPVGCLLRTIDLKSTRTALRFQFPSVVVWELTTENRATIASQIENIVRQFPLARVVVVTHLTMRAYRPLVCEAGAVAMIDSPRQLPLIKNISERHMTQSHSTAFGGDYFGEEENMLENLPWSQWRSD